MTGTDLVSAAADIISFTSLLPYQAIRAGLYHFWRSIFSGPMPIPVLMYHALDPEPSPIAISPEAFARQMRWLHDRRYRVIPLSWLVEHLRNQQALPARSVVLTFDDGFESVYTHAFPLLAKYDFPATVFLVSDYCGRTNAWPDQPLSVPPRTLLDWSQIKEMAGCNIEFGAHTVTHPWLDRLTPQKLEDELLISKNDIEAKIGQPVTLFAYPYGRYNQAVKAAVEQLFDGACTTYLELVNAQSDPLEVERIESLYVTHPLLFQAMFSRWFFLYLFTRRSMRRLASVVLQRPWQ